MLIHTRQNYNSKAPAFNGIYKLPHKKLTTQKSASFKIDNWFDQRFKESTNTTPTDLHIIFETLLVQLNKEIKNNPIKAMVSNGNFYVFTGKDVELLTQFRKNIPETIETGYTTPHTAYRKFSSVDFTHSEEENKLFATTIQASKTKVQTVGTINSLLRKIFNQ